MGGAAPILFWCGVACRPRAWSARRSGALVRARPSAATPTGAGGWGRCGARSVGPAASPPPRFAVPSGEVGRPLGSRGAGCSALMRPSSRGGAGGGVLRRPLPARPVGCRPAILCLRCAPPAYTGAVGVAGQTWASGAARSAANGSVRQGGGREGGSDLLALVRAPAFPRPASEGATPFAPSWAPPVGRRSVAGRAGACGRFTRGACRGRGAPPPQGRCLSGLPPSALGPEGGGGGGGPLVPWRRPATAAGGVVWGFRPRTRTLPPPLSTLREPDPHGGPCWGPLLPPPSSRGAGRLGAAVRVSGQRLVGCGAVGSPPRSLSPPSLPREVARAPPLRRIVGGAWIRGARLRQGGASNGTVPPPLFRVRRLGRHLRRRLCGGWGGGSGGFRRL